MPYYCASKESYSILQIMLVKKHVFRDSSMYIANYTTYLISIYINKTKNFWRCNLFIVRIILLLRKASNRDYYVSRLNKVMQKVYNCVFKSILLPFSFHSSAG